MSKLTSLNELLIEELKDLYSAEKQLTAALPKMAKKASSPELQQAFQSRLEETKGHVERLEQVCQMLEEKPTGKVCKAMKGLVEEAQEVLEEEGDPSVIDAALIASAQRVEHYEIAGYGCVITFAEILGLDDCAEILKQTFEEEEQADKKLTSIAKTINAGAPQEEAETVGSASKK
ncbi:MAG TPA: ferritin-like domain-containing protein [Fimbriimonadaceae bacterium]|jgi:ferritin-like metal-binding protein YciE